MLEIKTIDKLPIGALHRCFIEIMSHHAPASSFPPEAMMRMNTMRGVDYRASLCAMEGDRMVAFILNSVGIWDRKHCYSSLMVLTVHATSMVRQIPNG